MKYLIYLYLSINVAFAASKTTVYSQCTRIDNENKEQKIIATIETLSEKQCKALGAKKAELYAQVGWVCVGRNNEALYSCESERAQSFALYKGIKLDNLTYTNLQKHRGMLAYINPDSNKTCHDDQAELKSAGVKDAICHKRQ